MFWDAVQYNCYLTWSSLPLLRHKASTLALYWTLFFAISFRHPVSSQYCPALLSLRVSIIALVFLFSFAPGISPHGHSGDVMAFLFQGMANPFPLPSLFVVISLASPSVFPMLSSSFVTACLHDSFGLHLFPRFLPVVPRSWWHSAKRCQVSGRIFLLKYVTVVY